ncbi:MAG: SDR family NAD(P)-dependent oxidoreductase [Haloarculaceae archaeon]
MADDSGADDDAYEWLSPGDVGGVAERFRLDGDVALVTGASKGIGRATAFALADAGADVAVASRDREACRAVVDELEGAFDAAGHALAVDVADPDAVEAMVEEAAAELGRLDILVNNAGASFAAPTTEVSPGGWDRIVEVNLKGTYLCSTAALDRLAGGGRVVNFSSIAGQFGSAVMSHYGAAKAGVENLTRSLAGEWADRNVRVNCIAPGLVLTPGAAGVLGVGSDVAHDRSRVDRTVGSAAEVADTVLFLASPASSYLTGETIVVEGPPTLSDEME